MEQFLYRFRDITVYSPQIFGDGRTDTPPIPLSRQKSAVIIAQPMYCSSTVDRGMPSVCIMLRPMSCSKHQTSIIAVAVLQNYYCKWLPGATSIERLRQGSWRSRHCETSAVRMWLCVTSVICCDRADQLMRLLQLVGWVRLCMCERVHGRLPLSGQHCMCCRSAYIRRHATVTYSFTIVARGLHYISCWLLAVRHLAACCLHCKTRQIHP